MICKAVYFHLLRLTLLTFICDELAGQSSTSGSPERLYFSSANIFEDDIPQEAKDKHLSGTFWVALRGDTPVVLTNSRLTKHEPNELKQLKTTHTWHIDGASTTFIKAMRDKREDTFRYYTKLSSLWQPDTESLLQQLSQDLYFVQSEKRWDVVIDGSDFKVWQLDKPQVGLIFSCREHAKELLGQKATFDPRSTDALSKGTTWLTMVKDSFGEIEQPIWIVQKDKSGAGRILHWKEDGDWYMWLPNSVTGFPLDLAFRSTESTETSPRTVEVDEDVFERLKDRAYSVPNFTDNLFTNPAVLTRRMDRDTNGAAAITLKWQPQNRYQSKWFDVAPVPGTSEGGVLPVPGMKQIVVQTRDSTTGTFEPIKTSDTSDKISSDKMESHFGHWWPDAIDLSGHFGSKTHLTGKFENHVATYTLASEATVEQWIAGQGLRSQVESNPLSPSKRYFQLKEDEGDKRDKLENDPQNPTLSANQRSIWQRLTSSWDARVDPTDGTTKIFNRGSWGSFEVVFGHSLMLSSFRADIAAASYGSTVMIRDLQLNPFADYFVSRTIARMDIEKSRSLDPMTWNKNEFPDAVKSALLRSAPSQAARFFSQEQEGLLASRMDYYGVDRTQYVAKSQIFVPHFEDKSESELALELVTPLTEPVVFLTAFPQLQVSANTPQQPDNNAADNGASTHASSSSKPDASLSPFPPFSERLNLQYFDSNPATGWKVTWRLPRKSEVLLPENAQEPVPLSGRNWPIPYGSINKYSGSPYVSEWACDLDANNNAQYYVVGTNRWSDIDWMKEDLRKGIAIKNSKGQHPEFISPVIGMRWVIEITPPPVTKQQQPPGETQPSGIAATTQSPSPTTASKAKHDKLDAELTQYIRIIFGDGLRDENDKTVILAWGDVKKQIENNYGDHAYWKLQYLRYLVFGGYWGPQLDAPAGNSSREVPYDDLTDNQILNQLRVLFPDGQTAGLSQ